MSWVKKNLAPSKIVTPGTDVDVQVLEVDSAKRRISLGLKQTQENPWTGFTTRHPIGSTIEGEVKSITEFGLFVGLDSEIDGMVHLSDISWTKSGEEAIKAYEKGQMVKAKVLDIDVEKERVSLGIKQLDGDPIEKAGQGGGALRKNQIVTATVTEVNDGGIEVSLADGVKSFIRRADLARDRNDQRPERFGKGDKIDAMVTSVDKATRKGLALHQGPRNLGREGSGGAVRFFGFGRIPGRYPGRGAEEEDQEGRRVSLVLIAERSGRVSHAYPFAFVSWIGPTGGRNPVFAPYAAAKAGTKHGVCLFGSRIHVLCRFQPRSILWLRKRRACWPAGSMNWKMR